MTNKTGGEVDRGVDARFFGRVVARGGDVTRAEVAEGRTDAAEDLDNIRGASAI